MYKRKRLASFGSFSAFYADPELLASVFSAVSILDRQIQTEEIAA